jgi:hypothetical protein
VNGFLPFGVGIEEEALFDRVPANITSSARQPRRSCRQRMSLQKRRRCGMAPEWIVRARRLVLLVSKRYLRTPSTLGIGKAELPISVRCWNRER